MFSHVFRYFPYYLEKKENNTTTIERMKNIVTAIFAGLHHSLQYRKPFSPLIGETFHGKLTDSTNFYAEQIQYNPPTAFFFIINPFFTIHGSQRFCGKLSANKLMPYFENFL